eukprot:CAMPEP_0176419486 /NCGR_PEP_ID=MMETSP0127-20121128/8074_1 /TAXON_ID=938130 /ORGANISM="Platyophrya macrostoma, Strain WH" /LENGTH=615 /DNA_ID=CAMNT_0017799969 /DNA_START=20 /DNA_END=1868 /DNA_ORIENTATION=-
MTSSVQRGAGVPAASGSPHFPQQGGLHVNRSTLRTELSPEYRNVPSSINETHNTSPRMRRSSSQSPNSRGIPLRPHWRLNDFDVGPKLGEGRFGKIYLCRERTTHYAVVLKIIAKEAVLHMDLMHQIQREVELHMYCRHRHILRMFAYFWDDERIFLALDYADGGNLSDISAVRYLHSRGIVHRDIKPENILFKKGTLKLADFTWAVYLPPLTSSPFATQEGSAPLPTASTAQQRARRFTLCGTIDYIAPEILRRNAYDEAVDMWSVGSTVFEVLVGHPPFETDSIRGTEQRIMEGKIEEELFQLQSAISNTAKDFLQRLLCVDVSHRMNAADAECHPFVQAYVEEERLRRRQHTNANSGGGCSGGLVGSHPHTSAWYASNHTCSSAAVPSVPQNSANQPSVGIPQPSSSSFHMSGVSLSTVTAATLNGSTAVAGAPLSNHTSISGGLVAMSSLTGASTATALISSSGHDATASTQEGVDDGALVNEDSSPPQLPFNPDKSPCRTTDATVERVLQFDEDIHRGEDGAQQVAPENTTGALEVSSLRVSATDTQNALPAAQMADSTPPRVYKGGNDPVLDAPLQLGIDDLMELPLDVTAIAPDERTQTWSPPHSSDE